MKSPANRPFWLSLFTFRPSRASRWSIVVVDSLGSLSVGQGTTVASAFQSASVGLDTSKVFKTIVRKSTSVARPCAYNLRLMSGRSKGEGLPPFFEAAYEAGRIQGKEEAKASKDREHKEFLQRQHDYHASVRDFVIRTFPNCVDEHNGQPEPDFRVVAVVMRAHHKYGRGNVTRSLILEEVRAARAQTMADLRWDQERLAKERGDA